MINHWRQKYKTKYVKEKTNVLNDLKKGMSNKEAAKKYGVRKNTHSTSVKNKENILKAYEAAHAKRQRLETAEFESIDAARYKRILSKRSENVPITRLIMKTQPLELAEKLNITNFQASDGWLRNWKES